MTTTVSFLMMMMMMMIIRLEGLYNLFAVRPPANAQLPPAPGFATWTSYGHLPVTQLLVEACWNIGQLMEHVYMYLEPKWPLFCLEKALFWQGSTTKIEDKQVPGTGMYTFIFALYGYQLVHLILFQQHHLRWPCNLVIPGNKLSWIDDS